MGKSRDPSFVLGQKQNIVGSFYENIAHAIFGGELSRNDTGDLCLWRSGTSIEVKASGFNSWYGFRLAVEQIENYEKLCGGFPFNRVWYVLFAYKNRPRRLEDGTHSSEMAVHKDKASVQGFLAERTLWCTVVDLSVVIKWKQDLKASSKSIMGHLGAKSIDFSCKKLDPLFNSPSPHGTEFGTLLTMGNFGVCEKTVLSGDIEVTFEGDSPNKLEVRFPMKMILPWEEFRGVQRRLRRRGFRLKREL